jgi:hypothetical protein
MIAGARTVRTITTWSDGSEIKSDDYSRHWIALAIALAVLAIMTDLMSFWAFYNLYVTMFFIFR